MTIYNTANKICSFSQLVEQVTKKLTIANTLLLKYSTSFIHGVRLLTQLFIIMIIFFFEFSLFSIFLRWTNSIPDNNSRAFVTESGNEHAQSLYE